MNTLTCDEVLAALPALALDALENDERSSVLAHLDACPGCRLQLLALRDVADGLAMRVPQRTPPLALKSRLMARVNAEAAAHHAPLARPPTPSFARRMTSRLRQPRHVLRVVMATVAIALVAAVAVPRLLPQPAPQPAAADLAKEIAANSTASIALAGTDEAPGASAKISYRPDDSVAAMETFKLPPLGAGQAYQLWLVDADGKRDSGCVFTVNKNGWARVVIRPKRPLNRYVRFGVSLEPEKGSQEPTGPAVLRS
jgi:anti-sigma-K factor RskA